VGELEEVNKRLVGHHEDDPLLVEIVKGKGK
jgi:hypothetical protein